MKTRHTNTHTQRERERERERDRQRETDRQRQTETDRQTERTCIVIPISRIWGLTSKEPRSVGSKHPVSRLRFSLVRLKLLVTNNV